MKEKVKEKGKEKGTLYFNAKVECPLLSSSKVECPLLSSSAEHQSTMIPVRIDEADSLSRPYVGDDHVLDQRHRMPQPSLTHRRE